MPITVSSDIASGLAELSRREGVTLFMTLLAAINVLLNQYTGQEDLAVGTHIANRNRSELERVIGFFVNNLVLRTDLSGDPVFRELLSRVRGVALKAYAHQDLPFEKLVEALHPQRDPSQTPLFQVAFVWNNLPGESLESEELSFSPLAVESETSKFDLTFFMAESGPGLIGSIEYNSDLFRAATIDRMREHFQTLLTGIAADPDRPISGYSLVPQSQHDHLISNFIVSLDAQ